MSADDCLLIGLTELPGRTPRAFVRLRVTCRCGSEWDVTYWSLKFDGTADIGGGLDVDEQHLEWIGLLLLAHAVGGLEPLEWVQQLRETGTPPSWGRTYLVSQRSRPGVEIPGDAYPA